VGEFLIKQGQRANDEVFLIKSGKVDIMIAGDSGESIKVATREAGEFVGEMSVGRAALRCLLPFSPHLEHFEVLTQALRGV